MLQAQGLQPLDPYRTLQVQPHAPRDLIDEAYYALAARANSSAAAYARLRDLNDAYALLTDEGRRERYDARNGLTRLSPLDTKRPRARKPLLPGRRRAKQAYAERYYDILSVDTFASADVIEVAYRILSRKYARGRTADPDVIAAIDEAYHTLGNPHLRAQYDANLPARAAAPPAAPPAPTATQPAPQPAMPEPAAAPPAPGPSPVPSHLQKTDEPAGTPLTHTPQPPPLHSVERGPGGEVPRLVILRAEEPPSEQAPAPDGSAPVREIAPVRALRDFFRRRELARETAAETAARLAEEARTRLVDLRDGGAVPQPPAALPPELLASPASASLGDVTFLDGPYAGRSWSISDSALILGDLDPLVPEYGRVSPYGGECMLRQAPGIEATVNGEPMAMPLAFLDDGDEVMVGPHRFRFARTPAAEPIPFESLQSS